MHNFINEFDVNYRKSSVKRTTLSILVKRQFP